MAAHKFIVSSESVKENVSVDCENYVIGIFLVMNWAIINFPAYIYIKHISESDEEFISI